MAEHSGSRHGPEPAQGSTPWRKLARAGFIEYDRVIFLSDAVFAIAITLLAINLHGSAGSTVSAHEIRQAVPRIAGFAISFVVIAFFWFAHHRVFRYVAAIDPPLIALNFAFLAMIAFLPYPTDLLSVSNTTASVIFYATCCALAGLAQAAFWLYATRSPADLTTPAAGPVRIPILVRMLRVPVVFALSIPIAIVAPNFAPFIWLLIWISGTLLRRFQPLPAEPED
ncbi:MAG TPA: TMEM175 family protein [Streptosporangiaceae bacterium]|nr:TMEM175 family protein [Streptosporangiaceae bacterium]